MLASPSNTHYCVKLARVHVCVYARVFGACLCERGSVPDASPTYRNTRSSWLSSAEMKTEANQKSTATCTFGAKCTAKKATKKNKKQICHRVLNKITFTRLPLHTMSASSHGRCEDESASSVGMLWRAGKHGGINEPTGSGEGGRRAAYHLAVGGLWLQRFIPPANDETHCEIMEEGRKPCRSFASVVPLLCKTAT